jgi:DNA repair protein RecO (recombination protein O)
MSETFLTHAISLHWRYSGERSRLVIMLSEDRGRIQAIAQGIVKPSSSLRPATEPLNEGLYRIVRRKGFDLMVEWEPINHFLPIHHSPQALATALYCVQFPLRFLPPGQPEPAAYYLLKNILLTLCDTKYYDICRVVYELGFLGIAGHAIDFSHCIRCGESGKSHGWRINIPAGGLECPQCASNQTSAERLTMSAAAIQAGKVCVRLADVFSAGTFEDHETGAVSLRRGIAEAARNIEGSALKHLGMATSAFSKYHFNESVDKWLVAL